MGQHLIQVGHCLDAGELQVAVGAANLICLPIATKLKAKARRTALHRELMMEGVLAIQEGLNPKLIDEKLRAFVVRQDVPARPVARRRAA